jgi:CRISPR-associated protein Cmr6
MKNIGWYFYRNYFTDAVISKIDTVKRTETDKKKHEEKIQKIFHERNTPILSSVWEDKDGVSLPNTHQEVRLRTTYPGLLSGGGIAHAISEQGEFKLGFSFDHTTGQPYLPGSSVKGTLRSVFPYRLVQLAVRTKDIVEKDRLLEKAKALLDGYWTGELKTIVNLAPKQVFQLEWAVFEGLKITNIDEIYKEDISQIDFKLLKSESLESYERDIFFDAFIKDVQEYKGKKKFMADDYITPHPNPLKNPIPIQFLKILPNVVFGFKFSLKDSVVGELKVTTTTKIQIFQKILEDFGIGAKTNVGYGQLETL